MLLDGTPTGLEPYVASIKSLFFTTCCFNAASCPSGRLLLINLKKIKDMTRQEFIDRTDEFFRYRKALMIARLFLKALKPAANSEELVMTLNEVDSALAAGTGSKA